MRLAFRGIYPRMLGASGRRLRGGPTPFTGILPHISGVPGPPRRELQGPKHAAILRGRACPGVPEVRRSGRALAHPGRTRRARPEEHDRRRTEDRHRGDAQPASADEETNDHSRHRRNPLRRPPVVAVRRSPVRREAAPARRRAGDLPQMPAIQIGDQLPETPRSEEEDCEEDLTGRRKPLRTCSRRGRVRSAERTAASRRSCTSRLRSWPRPPSSSPPPRDRRGPATSWTPARRSRRVARPRTPKSRPGAAAPSAPGRHNQPSAGRRG